MELQIPGSLERDCKSRSALVLLGGGKVVLNHIKDAFMARM